MPNRYFTKLELKPPKQWPILISTHDKCVFAPIKVVHTYINDVPGQRRYCSLCGKLLNIYSAWWESPRESRRKTETIKIDNGSWSHQNPSQHKKYFVKPKRNNE